MNEPNPKDEEKKRRLAEALRANLRRRKDQAREQRDAQASGKGEGDDDTG